MMLLTSVNITSSPVNIVSMGKKLALCIRTVSRTLTDRMNVHAAIEMMRDFCVFEFGVMLEMIVGISVFPQKSGFGNCADW